MDPRYTQYPQPPTGVTSGAGGQAYGQPAYAPHGQPPYGQHPQYLNQHAYPTAHPPQPGPGYYPNSYPPQQYPPQYGQIYTTPTKAPQNVASAPASVEPTVEVQWLPPTNDIPIVDKWFATLDNEHKGIVGGLEIAKFLQKSNLPKDSLRTIWSLIDNKNLGYVNKSQFNNIIRLVSISCSPIYMGAAPSLERLQKTLYDKIPLPAAFLVEDKANVPATAPVISIDLPGLILPSQHGSTAHNLSTVEEDDEFSDFASHNPAHSHVPALAPAPALMRVPSGVAAGSALNHVPSSSIQPLHHNDDEFGPMASAQAPVEEIETGPQWVPSFEDKEIIDKWFTELDTEMKGTVGGLAVAMFLKKSNLPKDSLRTIWSLIDNKNRGYVNKFQFTNIIRLVSISCSPIYMGSAPNMERFERTLKDSIRLPYALLEDVTTKPAEATISTDTSAKVQYAQVNMHNGQSVLPEPATLSIAADPAPVSTVVIPAPSGAVQWVPPSIEQDIIDRWWSSELDKDGAGAVKGLPVAMFLKRSNLPKEALREIWSLIDTAGAGSINKDQFVNMMRLVSIQCSPVYYAQAPSLERLEKTLSEYIPLPLALVHDGAMPSVVGASPVGEVAPETLPPLHTGPSGNADFAFSPPLPIPSAIPRGTSVSTLSDLSADGGDEGVSGKSDMRELQWMPAPEDAEVIDRWFAELDQERRGLLGGLAVAMFFKRTNLPKEALRSIWSLIDSRSQGQIDRGQFINMIRLVSIQCAPEYASFSPSMERLDATLSERIPLPPALFIIPSGVGAEQTPAPVVDVRSISSGTSVLHAEAPELTPESQWVPFGSDKTIVDGWFTELDTEMKGTVGGLVVAMFLKKSNLPKDSLRTIWSLIDNKNRGSVNQNQFYNIVRLVSIACSPIYMGTAPSLERFEKTLKDDISLPFALTNAPLVAQIAAAPAVVPVMPAVAAVSADDEDEVGEFSSHMGPGGAAAIVAAGASESGAGANRLSVFDDLVESDLKAVDEEWEDFTEAESAVAESSPTTSVPVPAAEPTSIFDSVVDETPPLAPASAPAIIPSTGVEITSEKVTFSAPAAPGVTVDDDSDMEFEEFTSAKETASSLAVSESAPSSAFVDPFEALDLAESPVTMALTAEEPESVPGLANAVVDDEPKTVDAVAEEPLTIQPVVSTEPLETACAPSESGTDTFAESTAAVKIHDDPFAFDDDGPVDAVLPPLGSLSHKHDDSAPEDDAFGSFDAIDAPPTVAVPLAVEAVEHSGVPQSASVNSFAHAFDSDEAGSDAGDDFGDFGDFETHTPVPAMSQQVSELSLFDYNESSSPMPSGQMQSSVSEMSLFDAPAENQMDSFMMDAFHSTTSLTPVPAAEPDLLDFLSEPVHTAPVIQQAPVESDSTDFVAFGAFNDAFPTDNFSAPVEPSFSSFSAPAVHSAPVEDLFAAPVANSANSKVPAPLAPLVSTPAQIQDDKLLQRKPLKYKELEALTAQLHKKNLHEQAYNCNEQAKLMRRIHDLTLQKAQAVEDDDLETAMALKRDINNLTLQSQGVDQEAAWEEDASSNRRGDSLQEVADLIGAVDSIMGAKFSRKFMSSVPPASASVDSQLKYAITAKRYARMTIAICSTHEDYPKQWLQVLQVAVNKVKEGNDIVARFKKMNETDRNAVVSHLKMSEYALGLLAIAEIGLWVSASCMEAMVHEKIAEEVFAVCQDLLLEVDQLWGMGSRFKSMTLETLTLEAARLAEHSQVQYCNFTLRPMSYETSKVEAGKLKINTVKLYNNPLAIDQTYFMEPVVKLWVHDISKSLPKTAAAAF